MFTYRDEKGALFSVHRDRVRAEGGEERGAADAPALQQTKAAGRGHTLYQFHRAEFQQRLLPGKERAQRRGACQQHPVAGEGIGETVAAVLQGGEGALRGPRVSVTPTLCSRARRLRVQDKSVSTA